MLMQGENSHDANFHINCMVFFNVIKVPTLTKCENLRHKIDVAKFQMLNSS